MAKLYENTRKPEREGKLITIGKAVALPDGRGATIQLKNETEIALFNVGGRFFAIENMCPHRGYPLADSRTYGETVECDLHGYRFNLNDGSCLTDAECSLESYEVFVEEGILKVLI
jgi:nitrite reductase/ring-hydroxylating ferredoxin subunit